MSTPIVSAIPSIETRRIEEIQEDNISLDGTPQWFTKDYFQDSLRTYFKDQHLKIYNLHAIPALGKGDNYCGVLWRVKADFSCRGKLRTGQYIVKTNFDDGDEFVKEKLEPYDVFNREMCVYENILPKLKKLLVEIDDNESIYADTIAVDYENSALIFEDLTVRDFKMPNRLDGLNMKIMKIVLRKLAKMHATSAVLNERENGDLQKFDRGMFNRHTESYKPAFVGLLEAGIELVKTWKDFEIYAKKLEALKPMYMELCKRAFDPTKGHVNVLAHGDLWTNNIMVKYDEVSGEPVDAIIIDFQYAVWGSPAIDLFYLFNTSLEEDMHLRQQEQLIQYYYSVFAATLRKLSHSAAIPSLHKFHLQLEEKAFYGLSSSLVVLPVQRNEFTDDADFNALMKDDERAKNFKRTCYFKNKYCQHIIRQLLPIYDRRGLLEADQ